MAIGNSNKQSYKLPIDKKIDSVSIQSLGTNLASNTAADGFAAELVNFEPGKGDEWVKRRGTKLLTSPIFKYEFYDKDDSDSIWDGPADNSIMFEDNGNLRVYHLKNGVIFNDKGIAQDFFTYNEIFNWNLTPSTIVEEGEEDYEKRFQLHGETILNRPWKYNDNGERVFNTEYNWKVLAPTSSSISNISKDNQTKYNFIETANYAIWTIGAIILYFPKGSSWSISQIIESDSYYTGCELVGKVLSGDPVVVPDAYNETYNDNLKENVLTDLSTKEGCENLGGSWRYSCIADETLGQYCSENNDYYKQYFCEIDTTVKPQDDIENEIMIPDANKCNELNSIFTGTGDFAFQALPQYQSKTTITTEPLVDAETGILIRDGSTREAGKVWSEVPPEVINNESYDLLNRINYLSDRPGYRTTTFIPTSLSDTYLTPLNDGIGISKATIYENSIDIQEIELEPVSSTTVEFNSSNDNIDLYLNNARTMNRAVALEDDEYIDNIDLENSDIKISSDNVDRDIKELFLASGLTPVEFTKENNISSLKVLKILKSIYKPQSGEKTIGDIAMHKVGDMRVRQIERVDWTDEFVKDKKLSNIELHTVFENQTLNFNGDIVSDIIYNPTSTSEFDVLDNVDIVSDKTQGYFNTVSNYSIPSTENKDIFNFIKETPVVKTAGISPSENQRLNTYTKTKGLQQLIVKGNVSDLERTYDEVAAEILSKGMYLSDELGINYVSTLSSQPSSVNFSNIYSNDNIITDTESSIGSDNFDFNTGYGKLGFSPDTRRNFTTIRKNENESFLGYIKQGYGVTTSSVWIGTYVGSMVTTPFSAQSPFHYEGFSKEDNYTFSVPLLSKHFVTENPISDSFTNNDVVSDNKYIVSTMFQNWVPTTYKVFDEENAFNVTTGLGSKTVREFTKSYIEILDNNVIVEGQYVNNTNLDNTLRSYGFIDINLNDRDTTTGIRSPNPTFRYQTIDSELTPDNKLLTLNIKDTGELVVSLADIDKVANVFEFDEVVDGVENDNVVVAKFKDSVPNVGFYNELSSQNLSDSDGVTYVNDSQPGRGIKTYNPLHFGDNFEKIADLDWMGLTDDSVTDNIYGDKFYGSLKIEYIGNNKVMVYQKYNKKIRTTDNHVSEITRYGNSGYEFTSKSNDYNYEIKAFVDLAIIDLSNVTEDESTFNLSKVKFITKELTPGYLSSIYEEFNNKDDYETSSGYIYLSHTFDVVSNGRQIGLYPIGKHKVEKSSDNENIINNIAKMQSSLPYWTIDIEDIGVSNAWIEKDNYSNYKSIHNLPNIFGARELLTDKYLVKTPKGCVNFAGRESSLKEGDSYLAILEVDDNMIPSYNYKGTSTYADIYKYWSKFNVRLNNETIAEYTTDRIKREDTLPFTYGNFLKLRNDSGDDIKYKEISSSSSSFHYNPNNTLLCGFDSITNSEYRGVISDLKTGLKRSINTIDNDVNYIHLSLDDIIFSFYRSLYGSYDALNSDKVFEAYNNISISNTYTIFNKFVQNGVSAINGQETYKVALDTDIDLLSFDFYNNVLKDEDVYINNNSNSFGILVDGVVEYPSGVSQSNLSVDKSINNVIDTREISEDYSSDKVYMTVSSKNNEQLGSTSHKCYYTNDIMGQSGFVYSKRFGSSDVINLFNGFTGNRPANNIPNIFTYSSEDLVTVNAKLNIFDIVSGVQLYDSGLLTQPLFTDSSSVINFNSLITYMADLGYQGISQIGPDNIKVDLKVSVVQNGVEFELDVNDYVQDVMYILHKRLGRIPEDGSPLDYLTGLLDLNDVENRYEMVFNLVEINNILNEELSYKLEISFQYQQKLKTILTAQIGNATGDKIGVRGIVSQLFNDKFNMGSMFEENIRKPMFRIIPVVEAPIIGSKEGNDGNGSGVYDISEGVVSFQAIFNSDVTSDDIYQVLVNVFDIDNLAQNTPYQVYGIYKELTTINEDGSEVPVLDSNGNKQYETTYAFNTSSNNGRWQRGIQYDNGVQLTGSGERQFIVDITVPVESSIWMKSESDLKCIISPTTNDCIRCNNASGTSPGVCTYNEDGTVNNEITEVGSEEYNDARNIAFIKGWKPGFLWIEQEKITYLSQYIKSRIVQFSTDSILSDYDYSMKRSRDISNNLSQIQSICTFDDKIVVAYKDQVYISEGSSPTKFVYILENIPTHLGNIIKALPFEGSIMLFFERGYCTYTPTSSGSGALEFATPSNVQETAALISGDTISINSTYVDMLTKDGVERIWSYNQTITQEPTLTSTRLSSMITNVLVRDIQKSISTRLFSLEKLTIVKVKVQVDNNDEETYINRWYIFDNNDDFVVKSTQKKWYVWEGEVLDILNIKQYKDNNGDVRTVMIRADAPEVLQLGYTYKVNSDGTRNETLGTGVRSQVVDVSGHLDRAVKVTTVTSNGVTNDIYVGQQITSKLTTNPLAATALFDQKWKSYIVDLNHFGFEQTYYRKHYVLDKEIGDFVDQDVDMSVNEVVYEDGIWKVIENTNRKYQKASLNSNNTFNTKALFDSGIKDTFAINGEDTGQAAVMKSIGTTNDDEITLSDKVSLGSAKGSQFKITIVHDENKPFAFKRIKIILKLKKQK